MKTAALIAAALLPVFGWSAPITNTVNVLDLDAPVGEWNRLEVIARGNTLRYIFNVQVMNEAFDVTPSEGRVCVQAEGAEAVFRRFELWPLDRFSEPWPAKR